MLNWLKNLIALRNDIPAREPAVMAPPVVEPVAEPKKKPARKPAAKKAAALKKPRKTKQ